MNKTYILNCLFALLVVSIFTNCQKSDTNTYSFFVAGHTYGSPLNAPSDYGLHPPFLKKFNWLNQLPDLQFGILTGDVVRRAEKKSWETVWSELDSLNTKIHIAPGNHDKPHKALYKEQVGASYYAFSHDRDLFLILDGNDDGWNISGDQLAFLKKELSRSSEYRYIFLFVHQLIWWKENTTWARCHPNSFQGKSDTLNFHKTILPVLQKTDNQIFIFAGDAGAVPNSPAICYFKDGHISFISSGMGVQSRDNFLLVRIDGKGDLEIEPIGLKCPSSVNCLSKLEDYRQE